MNNYFKKTIIACSTAALLAGCAKTSKSTDVHQTIATHNVNIAYQLPTGVKTRFSGTIEEYVEGMPLESKPEHQFHFILTTPEGTIPSKIEGYCNEKKEFQRIRINYTGKSDGCDTSNTKAPCTNEQIENATAIMNQTFTQAYR